MTRALPVVTALVLTLGALTAAGQPPEALLAVERWKLTFDYEQSASNHTDSEDWTLMIEAHGSAILEHTHDPDELYGAWVGTPQVQVSYSHVGWRVPFETCRYEDEVIGSGSPLNLEDSAWLEFFEDGYQFNPSFHYITVNHTFRYICPDEIVTSTNPRRAWMGYEVISDSIPYPTADTELAGTLKGEGVANVEQTIGTYPFPTQVRLSYRLTPELDEVKLELLDSGAYDSWRPTAGDGGSPGKPLTVRAELVTSSGAPPPVKVERFLWSLRETSREPGISMNFPVDDPPGELDMRLEADPGDGGEVMADGQELERVMVVPGVSDEVRIVPVDWGAWSVLEVRALLTDGRTIAATTRRGGEPGLRLPRRAATSKVADVWKEKVGASGEDDADDEAIPEGDGHHGDGLSVYQEYRGFHEKGKHIEGDPRRKDFFASTVEAARAGMALFSRLSGLVVHSRLLRSELPESRVINGNRNTGPGSTKQHAILVEVDDGTRPDHGAAATKRLNLLGAAIGGPGTPGQISRVLLMSNWYTLKPAKRAHVLAHELFHCVNVYHHGDIDEVVAWGVDEDGEVAELNKAGASKITVYEEIDTDVTGLWAAFLSRPPYDTKPPLYWLGREGGQHSGDDRCLMRYNNADAYVGNPDVTSRYRTREVFVSGLCTSPAGTGVNDENRVPQSRFGAAATNRGACKQQILVNDSVEAPRR